MATLRLFASVAEAAGVREASFEAASLGELLEGAEARFGEEFGKQLPHCRVVVNGDSIEPTAFGSTALGPRDEVAILPPVAGG